MRSFTLHRCSRPRWVAAICALLALPLAALAQDSGALPQGGRVVAGQASLTQNPGHLTVAQQSERAIIEWQTFNIGRDATVQFLQPSATSVALNRVVGGDVSRIAGQLQANGRIYLVNSSGIVFGRTARVDAGQLVTSTLDIADGDFLTGNDRYSPAHSAEGGMLLPQHASREEPVIRPGEPGTAEESEGAAAAQAHGTTFDPTRQLTLDAGANGHLRLGVAASEVQALIESGGLVEDEDGLALTAQGADSLAAAVVAPAGTPSARGVNTEGERIWLRAHPVTSPAMRVR